MTRKALLLQITAAISLASYVSNHTGGVGEEIGGTRKKQRVKGGGGGREGG